MPTATEDDLASLQILAEQYVAVPDIRGFPSPGEVTLKGIVQPPDGIPGDAPAAQMRAALLSAAEKLVAALEPAGWQLTDGFELSFRTEIDNATLYIKGDVAIPSRQAATTLIVTMRMIRADLAAEVVRPQ